MPYCDAKSVVVVGLGNILMSDEGIGVHLLRELAGYADAFPHVDFLEAGSSIASVIHAIAFRRKAVFVDCARMREEPGAIRRFSPDDVISKKTSTSFSFHGEGLFRILELSRGLGEYPSSVVIFGIEPERIAPGDYLSGSLRARMNDYIEAIKPDLECGQI